MNPALPRSIVKLPYTAARLPFTLLEDFVIARYWDQNAAARVSFERWLGSLDLFAGRLLADDEITRRGQALMRPSGYLAHNSRPVEDAPIQPAQAEQAPSYPYPETLPAGDQAAEMRDHIAAYQDQDDLQQAQHPADRQATAGSAPPAAGQAPVDGAAGAAGRPSVPQTPATLAGTVEVTFTLPADLHAETVALCGEFNDWSADDIALERGSDGSWQATVALEPGRSYRYRYLLDGQRWENDDQADRYVPNPLGSIDSVIVVE
jgi:hypothetical protein